jgi:hypothetical protein
LVRKIIFGLHGSRLISKCGQPTCTTFSPKRATEFQEAEELLARIQKKKLLRCIFQVNLLLVILIHSIFIILNTVYEYYFIFKASLCNFTLI